MNDQLKNNLSPNLGNYKLKWHKFLIFFALWLGALMCVGNASGYLTGFMYGENASAVYSYYGSMKTLDVIMGIILLGLAAFYIYVRVQLADFKNGAAKKLAYLYIANALIPLLYCFFASNVTKVPFSELASGSWIKVLSATVMIAVNGIYYNKREALFVN